MVTHRPKAASEEQSSPYLQSGTRLFPITLIALAALVLIAAGARAQDQFVQYFDANTANSGLLGGAAIDPNGDFWLIGFGGEQRLRHVEFNGSAWSGSTTVTTAELALFYRSDDLPGGDANTNWGGNIGGAAGALQLNPAPLTIDVPIGGGATQQVVYPAGTLAFVADNVSVPVDPSSNSRPEVAKKFFRYDLRPTFEPTSAQPDFATAQGFFGQPRFGSVGVADWNDVFQTVVSEQDIRNQSGATGSDLIGRQFGWSSDGQWIYAVDSTPAQGGIYKIDPTRTANDATGVTRIWDDGGGGNGPNEFSIRSEPAIVATSAFDFAPGNPAVGDQIIVEGSFDSGNISGLNAFVDTGAATLSAPDVIFTEEQFRDFADYRGDNPTLTSGPRYVAVAADPVGNLYMYEQQTDMIFRYDTQGRFVKIANEREHNMFQRDNGGDINLGGNNDDISNMTIRISTEPGFSVTEIVYVDSELNAPIGILAFEPGDFDRDNDVDSADLALFSAALGTRNEVAADEDSIFDLNGNERMFRSTVTTDPNNTPGVPEDDVEVGIIRHTNNEGMVVDWGDVKVLQQFANIPDGDTNFDGLLDFTDLDTMSANYYTLGGLADKRWLEGDVASIDPDYLFDAVDANLVNEVDVDTLADAWLNDLGQAAPEESELTSRYSGQFLTDVLAAFDSSSGVAGDYNGDGLVDAADYALWNSTFGASGAGLDADGNGDGVIDAADYTIWRDNAVLPALPGDYNDDGVVDTADYTVWRDSLGQTGGSLAADGDNNAIVDANDYQVWRDNFGAVGSALAIPEPSAFALLALAATMGSGRSSRR